MKKNIILKILNWKLSGILQTLSFKGVYGSKLMQIVSKFMLQELQTNHEQKTSNPLAPDSLDGASVCPVFQETKAKPKNNETLRHKQCGVQPGEINNLQNFHAPDQIRSKTEVTMNATYSKDQNTTAPAPMEIVYRQMSDIIPESVKWLWPGRLALRKVSLIAGDPGVGKSQVMASVTATVTTGGLWPVDKVECKQGNVIILSAEDDASDTIRPRLDAAGADVRRVFILDAVIDKTGGHRSFNLAFDLERLGQMIEKIGGVALISIDPITAYLGRTDSHKNADVRALLAPLGDMAEKYNTAVIAVSHLNKREGGNPLYRVTDSLAFVAAARAAYLAVRDPHDGNRRLLLPIKNNIGNDTGGLAFSIAPKTVWENIETSVVIWEEESVTINATEAMRPYQPDSQGQSALDAAQSFLHNILEKGPLTSTQVREFSEGAGHAWRTIQRAAKTMGIAPTKDGMRGPWMWQLPVKNAKSHEECQANSMAAFDNVGGLRQTSGQIPSFEEEDFPHQGSYES